MIGFQYTSYMTFSYQLPQDEMIKILQFDGYPYYTIFNQSNLITYSVYNEKVICLSHFLHLYVIFSKNCLENEILENYNCLNDLTMFRYCQKILVNILIEYQYNQSKTLKVYPFCLKNSFISYILQDMIVPSMNNHIIKTLIFKIQKAIQNIVVQVLCDIQITAKKKIMKLEKAKSIIYILQSSIKTSFEEFNNQANIIFNEHKNCLNENQKLKELDTQFNDLNYYRIKRKGDVQENLQHLLKNELKNENLWHSFEIKLYATLPIITKEFRKGRYYSQQSAKNVTILQAQNQHESYDNSYVDQLIQEEIKNAEQQYKFEFNVSTIQKEINEVLLQNLKVLLYFQNDFQFMDQINLQSQSNQIDSIKSNVTKETVKEIFQDQIQLNILDMIDDLI